MILSLTLSICLCSTSTRDTTFSDQQVESVKASTVKHPYGSVRGIQAVYWLALPPDFATEIVGKLDLAPKRKTVEIELSATYDTGIDESAQQGWTNAVTARDTIKGRNLILSVSFGHHKMAKDDDKSPRDWGLDFYENLFKGSPDNVSYVLLVANEDEYEHQSDWDIRMKGILSGLLEGWKKDNGDAPFPKHTVHIRRSSKFGSLGKAYEGFSASNEYHFPEDGKYSKGRGEGTVSNDGQLVIRANDAKAKKKGASLLIVSLDSFKKDYGAKHLLLWHPALHLWGSTKGTYEYTAKRMNPNAKQRAEFLSLLEEFMKS